MKKFLKIAMGIIAPLILIVFFFGGVIEIQAAKSIHAISLTSELSKEKKWTKVYSFSGNGMKKSPVFVLRGGDAKLVYNYKALSGIGMGIFSVYVVDEGEDIMETGGFPEVMTTAENEKSESSIQKNSGRYYLYVNASGSWTISVLEYK